MINDMEVRLVDSSLDSWLERRDTRKRVARRKAYKARTSKLTRVRTELVALRRSGSSFRAIRDWLVERRKEKRNSRSPVAAISTIKAYLDTLPELDRGS